MGVKLDYARAKAEADLHHYLESGHQNVPDALRAAVCYLKTLTPGLISEYLKPDSQFPSTAVEDFRNACTDAEEDLWECHFRSVEFHCDCAFSQTDFMTGIYAELSQLQNRAVTDFWSARAEYLAKLGGEPPPSAVSAGADNTPSDSVVASGFFEIQTGCRASSSSDAIAMESPTRVEFEAGLAAAEVTLDQDLKDHGPSLEIARKYVVNATLTLARCILTPNCVEPYEAIQRAYDFAEWFAGEAIKPAWVWLCVFSEMETSGKLAKDHRDGSAEDGSPEPPSESEMREWHGCLYGVAHEALDEFVAEFWKERLKYFSTAAESSKATSGAGAIATTGHSAGEGLVPAVGNTAALGVRSGAPKQDGTKPRPGKERKGDASLLAGKRAVNFKIAEQYLGLTERQRQNLVKDQILVVEGKGQSKKITTDSLRAYVTPENPN